MRTCAGLHAVGAKSESTQLLGEPVGGGFGDTPPLKHGAPHVHQAVEEGAIGEHHRARMKLGS